MSTQRQGTIVDHLAGAERRRAGLSPRRAGIAAALTAAVAAASPAAALAHGAHATRLGVKVPAALTAAQPVAVTGQLRQAPNGHGLSGRTIDLYFRSSAASRFQRLTAVRTRGRGSYSAVIRLGAGTGTLEAVYGGNHAFRRAAATEHVTITAASSNPGTPSQVAPPPTTLTPAPGTATPPPLGSGTAPSGPPPIPPPSIAPPGPPSSQSLMTRMARATTLRSAHARARSGSVYVGSPYASEVSCDGTLGAFTLSSRTMTQYDPGMLIMSPGATPGSYFSTQWVAAQPFIYSWSTGKWYSTTWQEKLVSQSNPNEVTIGDTSGSPFEFNYRLPNVGAISVDTLYYWWTGVGSGAGTWTGGNWALTGSPYWQVTSATTRTNQSTYCTLHS